MGNSGGPARQLDTGLPPPLPDRLLSMKAVNLSTHLRAIGHRWACFLPRPPLDSFWHHE